MALDARTRSSIYEKLRPMLGDDDANALMSQFPAGEGDQLVTRDLLRAELAESRILTNIEIADLRTEFADLRTDFADLRTELKADIGVLRVEMHDLHRQTMKWMVGSTFTAMGLFAVIVRLTG